MDFDVCWVIAKMPVIDVFPMHCGREFGAFGMHELHDVTMVTVLLSARVFGDGAFPTLYKGGWRVFTGAAFSAVWN